MKPGDLVRIAYTCTGERTLKRYDVGEMGVIIKKVHDSGSVWTILIAGNLEVFGLHMMEVINETG